MPRSAPYPRDQVQALDRGLRVLAQLNRCNGLAVSDLAERVALPRPTVARILHTLQTAGYVYACPADGRYRVTAEIRRLSRGHRPNRALQRVAQPVADRLAQKLAWPIMVAEQAGDRVVVTYLTDNQSTLLVERATVGKTVPWTASALGLAFLAFLPSEERARIRSLLPELEPDAAGAAAGRLDAEIAQAQARGHVVFERQGRTAIVHPIMRDGDLVAAIGVRIAMDADRIADRLASLAGALGGAAAEIGAKIAEAEPAERVA